MPKVIKPEDDIKRLDILNRILDILGKKEDDSEITFFLSKMDLDEGAQKKIYELEPEIKKYYVCGKWSCFNVAKETKRKWLSIIKYICKEHDKTIETGNVKYSDGTYDTVYKIVLLVSNDTVIVT